MKKLWKYLILLVLGIFLLVLAACAAEPGIEPTSLATLQPTQRPGTEIPPASATAPIPTSTPYIEERFIEVEWPTHLHLGDSDIIRLALIPTIYGYSAQLEYPEHTVELEDVEVPYLGGYEAVAIARMDAVGMEFQPTGDQEQNLVEGESLSWRWTIYPQSAGRHRLSLSLRLRWDPSGEGGRVSEVSLWQAGLEIIVDAPFGLTAPQARALGIAGVLAGSVLVLPFAEYAARQRLERASASRIHRVRPNKDLILEAGLEITLSETESILLKGLFHTYERLIITTRFSSGYSGARTLLVRPFRSDGRADAHAIVKFGTRKMIRAEYANYQTFVRQTLPPITGRILGPPVMVQGEEEAVLQYTFVGTPNIAPVSLRSFALKQPVQETARLIEDRLFSTFGPAWWMQRRPYVFRMRQEYDHLLPVHLLLEAVGADHEASVLSGDLRQVQHLKPGDVVRIEGGLVTEVRSERRTATLTWSALLEDSPLRVRYRHIPPESFSEGRKVHGLYGQVVASRFELMYKEVAKPFPDLDLHSDRISLGGRWLINPLQRLEDLLNFQLQGTRSIIHGDLNLENILLGPGDLLWLIDFAATREGHTLYDFARLEVELTTKVVAEILSRHHSRVEDFLIVLDGLNEEGLLLDGFLGEIAVLLNAVRGIAQRCFYDPADIKEFHKALILAYLGSLKFTNLDEIACAPLPKALAFCAAAFLMSLEDR
ncbi:MAG: hypothetical protein A2Z14_06890 [Chloroflexi bacterium RBG_16_48_8]|nr:MAG: hypothetical protein A2Z14_06890 [Chloroflexi bacterium RBG_16_48_8]